MTKAAAGGALAVLTCTRVRRWPAWCLDLVNVKFSFSSALLMSLFPVSAPNEGYSVDWQAEWTLPSTLFLALTNTFSSTTTHITHGQSRSRHLYTMGQWSDVIGPDAGLDLRQGSS